MFLWVLWFGLWRSRLVFITDSYRSSTHLTDAFSKPHVAAQHHHFINRCRRKFLLPLVVIWRGLGSIMLFNLVPEQTVYFLKPVGQAVLLHRSLAAVCCFCSILWKPAGKSHAVVPGAMQREKRSYSLPHRELGQKKTVGINRSFSRLTSFHVVSSILYLSVHSAVLSSMFVLFLALSTHSYGLYFSVCSDGLSSVQVFFSYSLPWQSQSSYAYAVLL